MSEATRTSATPVPPSATTAHGISWRLYDNGQIFTDDEGRSLHDIATGEGCEVWTREGEDPARLYVFEDRSAIVVTVSWWDVLTGGLDGDTHEWMDAQHKGPVPPEGWTSRTYWKTGWVPLGSRS